MAGMLKCDICGKLYRGCRSASTSNAFRWQDVACSPEHGRIYLERLIEARKPKNEDSVAESVDSITDDEVSSDNTDVVYDDIDDVFDDDYDEDHDNIGDD